MRLGLKEARPSSGKTVAQVTVTAFNYTEKFAAIFAEYVESLLGATTKISYPGNVKVYLRNTAEAEDLLELCASGEPFDPRFNDDALLEKLERFDAHVQSVNFIFDYPEMRAYTA